MCSALSGNLHFLQIVQRFLGIPRKHANLQIGALSKDPQKVQRFLGSPYGAVRNICDTFNVWTFAKHSIFFCRTRFGGKSGLLFVTNSTSLISTSSFKKWYTIFPESAAPPRIPRKCCTICRKRKFPDSVEHIHVHCTFPSSIYPKFFFQGKFTLFCQWFLNVDKIYTEESYM